MANAFRTTVLLAALTALFMGVGYLIGGTSGMMIAFGVAVVTNVIGYWNSDTLVLRMQNASPLDQSIAPELYRMVQDLAGRAGLPTPKLYLIGTEQPNAFATGRDPEHAAVAVSSGLLRHLEAREVAAVIAHELAHIRSRDTLTMTISATFAGAIGMLAQFGLFFGGSNSRNNPLGGIGTLLAVLVAPLAAMVIQMAVSRTREYEADRDGAAISGDPRALASALEKIAALGHRVVNAPAERAPAMAHLYISNPLSGARMDNLFSTHPDVGNRIERLMAMADTMDATPRDATPHDAAPRRNAAPEARRPVRVRSNGGFRVPSVGPEPRGPWS